MARMAEKTRLHANSLFYGFDSGIWSDPTPRHDIRDDVVSSSNPWSKAESASARLEEVAWPASRVEIDRKLPVTSTSLPSTPQPLASSLSGSPLPDSALTAGGLSTAVRATPSAVIKAAWDTSLAGPLACRIGLASVEASTADDGSEPKGSESDGLTWTSETYFGSSGMAGISPLSVCGPFGSPLADYAGACSGACSGCAGGCAHEAALHSFGGAEAQDPCWCQVVPHSLGSGEAGVVYPPYLLQSLMTGHSFGGAGDEAALYSAFEAASQSLDGAPGLLGPVAGGAQICVGLDPGGVTLPSVGSYAHLSGQCSRCCFHPKGRCANGNSCQFCHFDHDKRPRNGKKKRYRRGPGEDDLDED